MPATITLTGDVDEALEAFDAVAAKMDETEQQAAALGVSIADLNRELDSRQQADYAASVKAVADEITGKAEAARDAAIEAKHLAEQERQAAAEAEILGQKKERMAALKASVTAVSTGFLALKEAVQLVGDAYAEAEVVAKRLAETGDAAGKELTAQFERAAAAAEVSKERWISSNGELTLTGQIVDTAARVYETFAARVGGVTEAEAARVTETRKLQAAQKEVNEEMRKRELLEQTQEVNDLAEAERRLSEAKKELSDREKFARESGATGVTEKEIAKLQEEILVWQRRREDLRKKAAEDEKQAQKELADERKKQDEEQARLDEEEHKRRQELAEKAAERQRRLTLLSRTENEATFAAERAARQEEAEHWLKLKGQEDQVHESRLRFTRDEAKKAVELAEFEASIAKTDEERAAAEEQRVKAKHALARAEQALTHEQRMKQIDEELKKEKAAEEELKRLGDPVATRLAGGERFDEILADRLQRTRDQFLKENEERVKALNDPASGLSDRDRRQEQQSLERGLAERLRATRAQAIADAQAAAGRRDRRRGDELPGGDEGPTLTNAADRHAEAERRRAEREGTNASIAKLAGGMGEGARRTNAAVDRLGQLVEQQTNVSREGNDALERRIENLERLIQSNAEIERGRVLRSRTSHRGLSG